MVGTNSMIRIFLSFTILKMSFYVQRLKCNATFSTFSLSASQKYHVEPVCKQSYFENEEILYHVFLFFPGLQDVLPEFLRGRFVEAALSYVACNSEGELLCRNNDCWCRCSPRFPECNCPFADIKVMEENLEKSKEAWSSFNQEFMESGMGCDGLYG